jgi:hypothetical protein
VFEGLVGIVGFEIVLEAVLGIGQTQTPPAMKQSRHGEVAELVSNSQQALPPYLQMIRQDALPACFDAILGGSYKTQLRK